MSDLQNPSGAELRIETALNESERRDLLRLGGRNLRGAKVADLLDLWSGGDTFIFWTEPFDDGSVIVACPKLKWLAVLAAAALARGVPSAVAVNGILERVAAGPSLETILEGMTKASESRSEIQKAGE